MRTLDREIDLLLKDQWENEYRRIEEEYFADPVVAVQIGRSMLEAAERDWAKGRNQ